MFAHARVVTWCTTHAKCPHWRKRTAGRFTGVRFHSAIINNVIWKSKKYEQNKRKDNTSVLTLQEIFCAITIYLIHVDPGVTADQTILYTCIHNYIYRPRTKTCSGSKSDYTHCRYFRSVIFSRLGTDHWGQKGLASWRFSQPVSCITVAAWMPWQRPRTCQTLQGGGRGVLPFGFGVVFCLFYFHPQ